MSSSDLLAKIEARQAVIGVIGLGYVGLAAAAVFAEAGFAVRGIEIDAARVALINAGQNPIRGREPGLNDLISGVVEARRLRASADYAVLRDADAVLIAVETPVDADRQPGYDALRAVCARLGPVLKEGALVIVESTLAPGTMRAVVQPLLEDATGRRVGGSLRLGHCPERLTAGQLLHHLRHLSRVCGADSPETGAIMRALYATVVQADIEVTDWLTAELVKTGENAYRDVNIAFANELGRICEALGGDFWRVRDLINTLPGWNVLMAGAGVGGHCLPKDPWLLIANLPRDVVPRLIPAARAINDDMPAHVARLTERALARHGIALAVARIALLGYSYLPDSDDTRNSPSEAVAAHLRAAGAQVRIHDPFVADYAGPLEPVIDQADALLVLVAHEAYRALDLASLRPLMRAPVLVDGRHVVSDAAARAAGFDLVTVGVGRG